MSGDLEVEPTPCMKEVHLKVVQFKVVHSPSCYLFYFNCLFNNRGGRFRITAPLVDPSAIIVKGGVVIEKVYLKRCGRGAHLIYNK
jgi:hypothetical protein